MDRRGKSRKGCKYTDNNWIHTTIFCKPSEWDMLNFLSAPSGKNLSTWIALKVLSSKGELKTRVKNKEEKGCIKSLCFEEKAYKDIKEKADAYNVSVAKLILGICLE